jgi:hypothetical protein
MIPSRQGLPLSNGPRPAQTRNSAQTRWFVHRQPRRRIGSDTRRAAVRAGGDKMRYLAGEASVPASYVGVGDDGAAESFVEEQVGEVFGVPARALRRDRVDTAGDGAGSEKRSLSGFAWS